MNKLTHFLEKQCCLGITTAVFQWYDAIWWNDLHTSLTSYKLKVAGNLKNDIWKEISQFTVNVMDSIVQLAWVSLEFDQSEKYHVHA